MGALALTAACHKGGAPDEPAPSDPAPSAAAENSGTKKDTPGSAPGSSGTTSDDPGPGTTTPAPPADPATVSDKVDVSEVKITVNGEGRRYLLAVPKNYDANKAYPLIIALHGDDQTADGFIGFSKLTLSTTDQAIVAFPDQVLDLFTTYQDNNDQRLVAATIIQLKKARNIDAGKIWGFGYSKGAFILNEMGCRKPGLFSAIAPHSGGAPQEQDNDGNVQCPAAIALPVFASMGANDDPEGGKFEADYWAGLAGCHGGTQVSTPDVCQAYNGCGSPVVYCQIPNHGHFPIWDAAASASWAWFKSL
jgi:polyhydroxybutyrate depolymerase